MREVPSHLLTDLDSVQRLHSFKEEVFDNRDFSGVASFDSIRKAFDTFYVTFLNNQAVDKDLISKNDFLRLILENYSSGRKNIRLIKNTSELSEDNNSWKNSFLFQVSIDILSRNPEIKSDLKLKNFPKDWDRFFKVPKSNYTIGGLASDFTTWKNINLDKLPINSIYLVDPYFLKDRKLAEVNLPEIIQGLIGNRSNVKSIEIAIFGKMDRNDPNFKRTKEENHVMINTILSRLYPNKNFKTAILYIPESKMHDRYLFTNFYYLSSGKGFNVYNDRKKLDQQKSNNLDIHILSEPNAFKNYLQRLSEVRNWINSSRLSLEYSGQIPTNLFEVF